MSRLLLIKKAKLATPAKVNDTNQDSLEAIAEATV